MELTEEQKKRFWAKVDKTDSCWLWTGSILRNGYGQVCFNNKMYMSHRISWLLAGNTFPDGHVIRHKCRSRHCVNPEHLETGTHAENMADKVRDGTDNRGEKCCNAKLTATQVLEIRERATESQRNLAKEYGIARSTIFDIVKKHTWKHI